MLYDLLPPLEPFFGALNVTRYITFRTAAASLTALAISLLLGPWMIASCATSRSARSSGRKDRSRTAPRPGRRRWAGC